MLGGVVAALAVLSGVTLAGCESTATGTPTPGPTGSDTSASSTQPTNTARLSPPVANPKNLRGIDPCDLLTAAQLPELDADGPGEQGTSKWGERDCLWENHIFSLSLAPDTKHDGLDGSYRERDRQFDFVPSEVTGYPAVRVNIATTFCAVIVGVADDQSLLVSYGPVAPDAPGTGDPCGFAESVAAMVLANLPTA